MCDQLDGRGCEVVDELNLVITNLEMTIADLKVDILKGLNHCYEYFTKLTLANLIEMWEAK